jgi:hypothetical protein
VTLELKQAWPVLVVIIPGLIAWGVTTTTVADQGEDIDDLKAKVEAIDATARAEEVDQAVFEQKVETMVTEQRAIKGALEDIAKEMREANAARRRDGG